VVTAAFKDAILHSARMYGVKAAKCYSSRSLCQDLESGRHENESESKKGFQHSNKEFVSCS